MSITADRPPDSPRLHVAFAGLEFSGPTGPENFSITSSLTNIYDGFTFQLDNSDGRNAKLLTMNLNRWTPITISHSDPQVDGGRPIPQMQGLITGVEHSSGDGPSAIVFSGFDLGKLFDSCGPAWKRLKGLTWGQLTDALIDPSWRAKPTETGLTWGIRRVISINLNARIKSGRQGAVRDYGTKDLQYVPPIQIEPGELCYDTLSRYAKLQAAVQGGSGSLVTVSALGDLQIFNPDDSKNDPPALSFEYDGDGRNQRIKSARLKLDGEGLYTDIIGYSTIVTYPGDPNKLDSQDPNAGKLVAKVQSPKTKTSSGSAELRGYLGVNRRLTFVENEQYTQAMLTARTEWKKKMTLWGEVALTYVVQGHSMPGASAFWTSWVPIVEGLVAEVNDDRNQIHDKMIIESVTRTQAPAPVGTITTVTLRRLGLLGG